MKAASQDPKKNYFRKNFDAISMLLDSEASHIDKVLSVSERYKDEEDKKIFHHGQYHGVASVILFLDDYIDEKEGFDFARFKQDVLEFKENMKK